MGKVWNEKSLIEIYHFDFLLRPWPVQWSRLKQGNNQTSPAKETGDAQAESQTVQSVDHL